MQKEKVVRLIPVIIFILLIMGCVFIKRYWSEVTALGSGSNINSNLVSSSIPGSDTPPQQTHRQTTVNVLAGSPFKEKSLDPVFWNKLEAFCQARPTRLIIADMKLVPGHMTRAGFPGRADAQYYALSRTVEGKPWRAWDDPDLLFLKEGQHEIEALWHRYIQKIVQIMKKAPKTTAVIIVNDDLDSEGQSLGFGTYRMITSVKNRIAMGDIFSD